jgi:hypothetical protein
VSTRALNSIDQSEINRWITAPRFRAFLEAAEGDQAQAMALYDWNVSVSAAFFEVLSYSEILLRNAIDADARSGSGQSVIRILARTS